MNINYLGHTGLWLAIEKMIETHCAESQTSTFKSMYEYQNGNYDLLIVDSQFYKSIIAPSLNDLYCNVLILGHYTDNYAQKAFCIDHRFEYIAYSQLEAVLPRYLKTKQEKAVFQYL